MWWLPPHFGPKTLATRLPLFFVSIFCPLEPLRLMACPKSKPCNWRKRAIAFLQRWMGNHWRDVFFFFFRRTFFFENPLTPSRGVENQRCWKASKAQNGGHHGQISPFAADSCLAYKKPSRLRNIWSWLEVLPRSGKVQKSNKGRWSHVCPPEAPHINIMLNTWNTWFEW